MEPTENEAQPYVEQHALSECVNALPLPEFYYEGEIYKVQGGIQ